MDESEQRPAENRRATSVRDQLDGSAGRSTPEGAGGTRAGRLQRTVETPTSQRGFLKRLVSDAVGVAVRRAVGERPGPVVRPMASITYYATSGVPKEESNVAGVVFRSQA